MLVLGETRENGDNKDREAITITERLKKKRKNKKNSHALLGKKYSAVNLKCPPACEMPASTILFWPLS